MQHNWCCSKGRTFAEVTKSERNSSPSTIWVDVGVLHVKGALGVLKFSLVGRWKNLPNSYPSALELEEWARTTWRLKGSLMVAFLNTDMMLLEFALPEEAKWVIESGRRWLWGGSLNLDWWSPDFGCVTSKEVVEEAWIWVVGLPLHLRSFFFF